jgi:plasmid maintenance system antidote protein VapI
MNCIHDPLQDWLGISAQMWLRMQAAYDLRQAERNTKRPHIERLQQAA